ncbi:ATP-binding protein [Pseudomonas sp. FBF18]|uniref:ATP-binding protein n=1 Tax=Pseudomonas TaxID=286 RepID=UPI001F45446C|nr:MULTISPECIES: ATP-binding protein [Pseudomonas]MCP8349395.1 ATP-binding protein [Pseudomonas sp. FBF18]
MSVESDVLLEAAPVRIERHYRRSVRIDADLGRHDALDGYVLTETAREALSIMTRQIVGSSQRAFTWTGPYGGGKSSLALVLAAAIANDASLRKKSECFVSEVPSFREAFNTDDGDWLVIPVVGRRSSILAELSKSFSKATGRAESVGNSDALIDALVREAEGDGRAGVLLIVDEMGKLLEASAAGGDDVHFFQDLAEVAARCRGKLVVLGILHQAFRQYASRLGIEARDEWAKVQGRFTDVSFVATGDEVVELIGRAIHCEIAHPNTVEMSDTIGAAISGRRPAVGRGMGSLLDKCWPLHPVTAALLGPASRRQFGQNERSVFGFLTSLEPHGFQDFLSSWDQQSLYGPDLFWDYLRANLEQAILASPDGHRWAQAVEAVERAASKGATETEISLAKALALIDMFRGVSGLAADEAVLHTVLPGYSKADITRAMERLATWRVALYRTHLGAWTIFEGSDFDIDQEVAKARATFVEADTKALTAMASLNPIIAKRHYHSTGTFRWLGVTMHSVQEAERLSKSYEPDSGEFGRLALVLPERASTVEDVARTLSKLQSNSKKTLFFGIPPNHELIADLGAELMSLRLVYESSPELEGDSVARREVAARLSSVKGAIEEALREAVARAEWLYEGLFVRPTSLSSLASDVAARTFSSAPRVWSELVNRDALSSNSVKARRDLLHRMVQNTHEECLGIKGYPAERGLYETLLSSTELHCLDKQGIWSFQAPKASNKRNFHPLWSAALKKFASQIVGTVGVRDLYTLWSGAPYGVKSGMLPVLAVAFMLAHSDKVAIYRDGIFEPRFTDVDVDEMLQDPSRFALRWVDEDLEKAQQLKTISAVLSKCGFEATSESPLDIARALVKVVFSQPLWTRRTQQLSGLARTVRDLLVKASDPHKLLFVDLPSVFEDGSVRDGALLESALLELTEAYPAMLSKVDNRLAEAIDAKEGDDPELRERAGYVSKATGDLRLEGFALRLQERDGTVLAMDNILSLAAKKPPRDWTDLDVDAALIAVADLSLAFRKAEALIAVNGRAPGREAFSIVIGSGGSSDVVNKTFEVAGRDREIVSGAATKVLELLRSSGLEDDLLLAALARAGSTIVNEGPGHA